MKSEKKYTLRFLYMVITFVCIYGVMFVAFAFIITPVILGFFQYRGNPMAVALFTSFVCVLSGGFCSLYLADRKILEPITKLSRATQRIAEGDFSVRLDESSRITEIHTVARNFNVMISELSQIETLRGDFIANVSHEFKTPLSAIEGYVTLLQDETLEESDRQAYINRILLSVNQLSELAGNILQISRIENQQIITQQHRFALDEQLRQALVLLEPKWAQKEIQLELDLPPVEIEGNPELLFQVWMNILGNAFKFTPKNGVVSVTAGAEWGEVFVVISDTGIGMTREEQKHIFEKFYQGDTSRHSEGNGLGLALAKQIVDLCGGTIQVESQIEEGSTFTVRLAVSPEKVL